MQKFLLPQACCSVSNVRDLSNKESAQDKKKSANILDTSILWIHYRDKKNDSQRMRYTSYFMAGFVKIVFLTSSQFFKRGIILNAFGSLPLLYFAKYLPTSV